MIQHPIPQNVTSYQFRLIGDMTIKQFIFLSVGVGAAIAFYYSNLFFLFKWFFVILSAITGFAVAFLPFEERPLDQWLINYIKAIYRPTFFIWKKQPSIPEYFTFTASISRQAIADDLEISRIAAARRQQGLSSYLTTLPQETHNELDAQERAATHSFTSLFQLPSASTSTISSAPLPQASTPQPPPLPPAPQVIPPATPISISLPKAAKTSAEEAPPPPAPNLNVSSSTLSSSATTNVAPATTSSSLPFPSIPTVPNVIVGMVIDASNKIVPGAIIEVLDESGLPARATKTNQLGQFFSTTPLKRGTYRINIDKPGLTFDTIELQLTGQIIEPLKIQAKP